jgi:murein DD-endopeptidase MepM/ murein hydrolase activator NlpD
MLGNQRGGAAARVLLVLVVVVGLAFAGLAAFRAGVPPQVKLEPGAKAIGRRTPVQVSVEAPGRGLSSVEVAVVQGDLEQVLATKSYTPRPAWAFWGERTKRERLSIDVGKDTVKGLKPGKATIRVTAGRPGAWLRSPDPVVATLELPVRLHPPALAPRSDAVYVAQGGSECIVYTVGESSVRDGVQAGGAFFPGYPLPGGGPGVRFALFAVPYDLSDPSRIRLVAEDEVGNRATAAFVHRFFPRKWHRSRLELGEAFLQKVVPEIVSQTPELEERGSLLETYLAINRDLRKANNAEIASLSAKSRPEFLWSRPFLRMAASPEADFADQRTYVHDGKDVDFQVHLGVDMADRQTVPVPSANDGVVVLAKYLGIYGNTVIVDHGYGLMTLYGHMSSLGVKEGDRVTRGQPLGSSGATGLAGGDHLHYSVLVHGTFVVPKEWWDGHWIQDRVARKLGGALRLEG